MPKLELTCNFCNKIFERYPSQAEGNRGRYCSRSCKGKDKTGEDHPHWNQKTADCIECNTKFSVSNHRVDEAKFCSYDCHYDHMDQGERPRYGKGWYAKREEIREMYDHRCVVCDTECDEKHHHVHHITPVREFDTPEDAHTDDNLILLCENHHAKVEQLAPAQQRERFK